MNIQNLFVIITFKDVAEKFTVEDWRKNDHTKGKDILITLFKQPLWVDACLVQLCKGRGSTFCWKDHQEGQYVELNEKNEVCCICGWWKCHVCSSCRCNQQQFLDTTTGVHGVNSE